MRFMGTAKHKLLFVFVKKINQHGVRMELFHHEVAQLLHQQIQIRHLAHDAVDRMQEFNLAVFFFELIF